MAAQLEAVRFDAADAVLVVLALLDRRRRASGAVTVDGRCA